MPKQNLFVRIWSNLRRLTEIENQSGCLLPCRYKEYQLVDAPCTVSMEDRMMNLIRATKTVLIETEVLLYFYLNLVELLDCFQVVGMVFKWYLTFYVKGLKFVNIKKKS